LFLQSLRHGKPCHLPLHKGGFFISPLAQKLPTASKKTTPRQPHSKTQIKTPTVYHRGGGVFNYDAGI